MPKITAATLLADDVKLGRPTSYRPQFDEMVLKYALLGLTEERMAELFRVTEKTFNNWKAQYPSFLQAIRAGREDADAAVAASLYKRALGYDQVTEHISTFRGEVTVTPTSTHIPADVNAASLWLRNRNPDRWRDKREVEHSGALALTSLLDSLEPDMIDITPDEPNADAPMIAQDEAGVAESGFSGAQGPEDGRDDPAPS